MSMLDNSKTVITIDGPAGAGKSTVAKRLAGELGIFYLDTGAMYRALTLKAIHQNIDLEDENALVVMANQTHIDFESDSSKTIILLDGEDVSGEIRTVEITNQTFHLARKPRIREIMVRLQRVLGDKKGVVVEGRDVGTVIFPHANYKFYLDANLDERSRRRIEELKAKGNEVDAAKLTSEMEDRDNKDKTRSVGPLKKADDAVFIDSTHLSIDEVIQKILQHIRR